MTEITRKVYCIQLSNICLEDFYMQQVVKFLVILVLTTSLDSI